jgi:hypothetical protein
MQLQTVNFTSKIKSQLKFSKLEENDVPQLVRDSFITNLFELMAHFISHLKIDAD